MKKKTNLLIMLFAFTFVLLISTKVMATDSIPIPKIGINIDSADTPTEYVDSIKLLLLLTVLTLLPSFIVMMTSFLRIIVVFGFLRSALGTSQSPPNQVLIGLALFLTIFIMMPTVTEINDTAVQPYINSEITQDEAIEIGAKPIRTFMLKQTRQKDLSLFIEISGEQDSEDIDSVPITTIIPSFMISELRRAFEIGFLLYIPFLIIDLVVASILMSMGMFMVPPVMVSLPFKLLLFVMVDGWYLIVKSLVLSFR
ncbi:MAG: flagellar type III secretion system pore protein FliP [Clostridiaceae bacterium]